MSEPTKTGIPQLTTVTGTIPPAEEGVTPLEGGMGPHGIVSDGDDTEITADGEIN